MNINLCGAINFLGYGTVTTNILSALSELGNDVSLFPINPHNMEAHVKHHKCIEEAGKRAQYFDCHAPSIRIWHQFDMAQSIGKGLRVGFPIFELDELTPLERHQLNSLDKIFVCSEWARDVLSKNGIIKSVYVIPLGVDREIFSPRPKLKGRKTIFLNVGKWEYRKGHDVLLECFNSAFTAEDDVELWMCNTNPLRPQEENDSWTKTYTQSKLGSKIKIIPRQESQEQLAFIMSKADFGIFPARAEGWNLEVLELMSLGIPSVVTNYAGHTGFCSADTSLLINIDEVETAVDGIWFKPGGVANQGKWAKITASVKEQIVASMKKAHNMVKDNSVELSNMKNNCIATSMELEWKKIAQKICTCLLKNTKI